MATAAQLVADKREGRGEVQLVATVEAFNLATGTLETFVFTDGRIPDHPLTDAGTISGLEMDTWPATSLEGRPGTDTDAAPSGAATGLDFGELFIREPGAGSRKHGDPYHDWTGSAWFHANIRPRINGAVAAGVYTLNFDNAVGGSEVEAGDRFRVDDGDELFVVLADETVTGGGEVVGLTFWPTVPVGGFADDAVLTVGSARAGSEAYWGHLQSARWQAYAWQTAVVNFVGTLPDGERVTWANRGTLIGAARISRGQESGATVDAQPGGGLTLGLEPPGPTIDRPVSNVFLGLRRAMRMTGGVTQKGEMTDPGADWQPSDHAVLMRIWVGVEYRDEGAATFLFDKTDFQLRLKAFSDYEFRATVTTTTMEFSALSPKLEDLERWYWVWYIYDEANGTLKCGWAYDHATAIADLNQGSPTATTGTLLTSGANIHLGATVATAFQFTGMMGEVSGHDVVLTDEQLINLMSGPIESPGSRADLVFYLGDYNIGMTEAIDIGPSFDPLASPTSIYNATLTAIDQGHSLEGGAVLRGIRRTFILGRANNVPLQPTASSDDVASDFAMFGGPEKISVIEDLWVDSAGGIVEGDSVALASGGVKTSLMELFAASIADDEYAFHPLSGTVRLGSLTSAKGTVTFDGWGSAAPSRTGVVFDGVDGEGVTSGAGLASVFTADYSIAGTVHILEASGSQTVFDQPNDGATAVGLRVTYQNLAGSTPALVYDVSLFISGSPAGLTTVVPAPTLIPFDWALTVKYNTGPDSMDFVYYINSVPVGPGDTIANAETGPASTDEAFIGTKDGGDPHANMIMSRLAIASSTLTTAAIDKYHRTPITGAGGTFVSAWEESPDLDPVLWPDTLAAGNDFTLSGGAVWLAGTTPASLRMLVNELALNRSGIDSTELDLSDSLEISTDPMTALTPTPDATPLEVIDSIRWGASAYFVFDGVDGTWKLFQAVNPETSVADVTIVDREVIRYTQGPDAAPAHAVAVGRLVNGLVQLASDIPAASPERVAAVGVRLRYSTPVVIPGNAEAYPQAEPLVLIEGAWFLESSAATEALRVAGIIGITERAATVEIPCPFPLLPPGKVLEIRSPLVEGGVFRGMLVKSSGSRDSRSYVLKA